MLNDKFKEYLMNQNDLCNTHMIQQSSKQDHTVTFYVSLLTLFIASKQFLNLPSQNLLDVFLSVIMVLVSIVFFCYLCSYIHWHTRFLNCAKVISYLILCEKEINDYKTLCLEVNKASNCLKYKGIYYGSQTILLIGYILVSSISYVFLLADINNLLNNKFSWLIIAVFYIDLLLISFLFAFLLYGKQLKKAYQRLPYILDFVNDFPETKIILL